MLTMGTIAQPGNAITRKKRTPNFPIAGVLKPFGIYPIMCHPVLPGETINSFRCKWRVLSKPVKAPLSGAWLETFLVYTKVTEINDAFAEMFVTPNYSSAGATAGSSKDRYFTKTGQIDWINFTLQNFVRNFFLDDGESIRLIDTVPQAKLNHKSWMNNLTFKGADVPADVTDIESLRQQMDAIQMAQLFGLSELTYEKFLGQYGVKAADPQGKPEILRYAPSWTLPINTVEPSTGVPSTAWMWSDAVEMSKPKRFDEPGFVTMFAVVRPKMFMGSQRYSFIGNLWGFQDWYPIYNLQDPQGGVRSIMTDDPVFEASVRTDASELEMLYDHNDLLVHGEQFVNNASAPTTPFSIPMSTGQKQNDASVVQDVRGEYATSTDVDGLFVSATATDKFCYYEGLASLDISGHVVDTIR